MNGELKFPYKHFWLLFYSVDFYVLLLLWVLQGYSVALTIFHD